MKITYEFVTGEVSEVEVDVRLGGMLLDLDRQQYNNDQKETRRHVSLDGMACEEGCLPIAPHLLFPQFLNEGIEEERRLGIAMGMELLALCDEVWVFGEATEGMAAEIASATEQGKKVIFKKTEGM